MKVLFYETKTGIYSNSMFEDEFEEIKGKAKIEKEVEIDIEDFARLCNRTTTDVKIIIESILNDNYVI